jgi:hypothetical protein
MSAASRIRLLVEGGKERLWRLSDFGGLPASAVAQALSRLTREGVLTRVGKGLYYHPRQTVFGPSQPSPAAVLAERVKAPLLPAGATAANLLGFSTQNPARAEFATAARSVPAQSPGLMRVCTRRPAGWRLVSSEDAALLDFLRRRGATSELSDKATKARLLRWLQEPERFRRLVRMAADEPARVRALLGATGEELGMDAKLLAALRQHLNPLSRFDFGRLKTLKYAKAWQAR